MRVIVSWLIVGYIALEILGFSLCIEHIGLVLTLGEVFVSAGCGLWLLRRELAQLGSLTLFTQNDIFSILRDSMLSSIGAILLFIPGVFSDIVGVALVLWALLPYRKERRQAHDNAKKTYDRTFSEYFTSAQYAKSQQDNDEIIDVEILESTSINPPSNNHKE